MFEDIKRISRNAKRLSLNSLVKDIISIDFIEHLIINLNTRDQLFNEGIDINSKVVGYYAMTYRGIDGHTKERNKHYDFLDSGEFFKSFRVKAVNGGFIISAKNEKMSDTPQVNNGEDLIGLTKENLRVLAEQIQPYLKQMILNKILQ